MKLTKRIEPLQPTTFTKPTNLNLQTRPFASLCSSNSQINEVNDATSIQTQIGSSGNLLEKLITTPISTVSPTLIQKKHFISFLSQPSPIQTKLNIGEPNDKYEKEADDNATKVVHQINSPMQGKSVQKQESSEEKNEELQMKPLLQRRENLVCGEASPDLESSIQSARSRGQSLDPSLQDKMGQSMGADFSGVKIHTDSQADYLNKTIQAKAFTTGQDIFFRQGCYAPTSRSGQELIAHELTHVVQQNGEQFSTRLKTLNSETSSSNTIQRFITIDNGSNDYPVKKESRKWKKDKSVPNDNSFFVSQEEQNGSFFHQDGNEYKANLVSKSNANLMVSENYDLAIEAGVEAKSFFATTSRISEANGALGGRIQLKKTKKYLRITDGKGRQKKLFQVIPFVPENKKLIGKEGEGLDMRVPQRCNEMAEMVTGKIPLESSAETQLFNLMIKLIKDLTNHDYAPELREAGLLAARDRENGAKAYLDAQDAIQAAFKDLYDNRQDELIQEFTRNHLNEAMDPKIGSAITTFSAATEAEMPQDKNTFFGYHFGSVVAKSGSDYITLENYARRDADVGLSTGSSNDPLFFFRMLGPQKSWHQNMLDTGDFIGRVMSFVVE
jgi:hypothetical protein